MDKDKNKKGKDVVCSLTSTGRCYFFIQDGLAGGAYCRLTGGAWGLLAVLDIYRAAIFLPV